MKNAKKQLISNVFTLLNVLKNDDLMFDDDSSFVELGDKKGIKRINLVERMIELIDTKNSFEGRATFDENGNIFDRDSNLAIKYLDMVDNWR